MFINNYIRSSLKRSPYIIGSIAIFLLVLCSCGSASNNETVEISPDPLVTPAPTPSPTPEPTPYEIELYGKTISSFDQEIDLTGISVDDNGQAAEEAASQMPFLKKIIMTGCGISDEEMNDINLRHENINFVWTVRVGNYSIRTDETAFIAAKNYQGTITDKTVGPLKYCTEMIALDLGHMQITDISFLYYMPHLRFLILADGPVSNLTPVSGLGELEYLELFKTRVTNLAPLLACKNLKDLNLCYIPGTNGDDCWEVLSQMTWLERLFYFGNPWSVQQRNELIALFPASAEVVLYDGLESTGLDWRYHERYYEMRDILDMYYMPGGTNGEDDKKEE